MLLVLMVNATQLWVFAFVNQRMLVMIVVKIFVQNWLKSTFYRFASHQYRELANYTEWRDFLHPKLFKEYAVISSIVVGFIALVTCIIFGILRAKRKDLVTSYPVEQDEENELVVFSQSDVNSDETRIN